jgi:hypothetical protein
VGTNGSQALEVTNLLPAGTTYKVVDEGNFSGTHDQASYYNFRLQENSTGQAQSYFLNVLQARDASGASVQVSLTQDATSWTITLDHPTLGHAVVVLNKGMASTGGSVGYAATGTPTTQTPLLDHVQSIQVTANGPVWGT